MEVMGFSSTRCRPNRHQAISTYTGDDASMNRILEEINIMKDQLSDSDILLWN